MLLKVSFAQHGKTITYTATPEEMSQLFEAARDDSFKMYDEDDNSVTMWTTLHEMRGIKFEIVPATEESDVVVVKRWEV